MEPRLVVGLFPSSGIAEDARNRLRTEGVPDREIAVAVLQPTTPLPAGGGPRTRGPVGGPLVFGNVRETFAKFISNGGTIVSVRAVTDQEAEFAAQTLRLYSPIVIECVPLSAGSDVAR